MICSEAAAGKLAANVTIFSKQVAVRFCFCTHYYACSIDIRAPYITPQTYTLFHRSDMWAFYIADKANVKLYIQNHTLCVNTRAFSLFEHVVATDASRQGGVHTRQVKGWLPAGGGGGRQAAREIELVSIRRVSSSGI
jgi:hypothetical protein